METEILKMFAQPDCAEEWVYATVHYFSKWVEKYGQSYWDMVRFYGHRKAILKELSRKNFATLLIKACQEGLKDSDSITSLDYNMQEFQYKKFLRKRPKKEREKSRPDQIYYYDREPGAKVCHSLYAELDQLYEESLNEKKESQPENSISQRILEYLEILKSKADYAEIFQHPTYGRYTPAFSYEQYKNEEFKKKRDASHIEVFECIPTIATEGKINELSARYQHDRRIKLHIVSEHGYDAHCMAIAKEQSVSLVRVNPNQPITGNCFKTARTIAMQEVEYTNMQMVLGRLPMNTPMVIFSTSGVTTSLSDVMAEHGIRVSKELSLQVPHWTGDYIEQKALEWVQQKVEAFNTEYQNYPLTRTVPYYDAEPESILQSLGYSIITKDLSESRQLAVIDMKAKTVWIDVRLNSDIRRRRFSLSHESGHAILHAPLSIEQFGETDETIAHATIASDNDYKWLEHHANHFAACLLMPKDVTALLYDFYYQMRFGRGDSRPIYLGDQPCQWQDFFAIARPMAEHMSVSIDAVKYRLIKLGFLIRLDSSYKTIRNAI